MTCCVFLYFAIVRLTTWLAGFLAETSSFAQALLLDQPTVIVFKLELQTLERAECVLANGIESSLLAGQSHPRMA